MGHPEAFEELKKYMDEVIAKSHLTRVVHVGRTIPVPSQVAPGEFEYVKVGFFEETPIGKKRLDFAHELQTDLNVLIGEAKAAYLEDAQKQPDVRPPSSAPPTRPAPAKQPVQPPQPPITQPDVNVESLLNGISSWSVPNEKGYQWCYRKEVEVILAIKQFIAEMDQMSQKWRRCGAYSYIISGDNRDLLGRIPWPPRGGK
jgi:hypothetical protein